MSTTHASPTVDGASFHRELFLVLLSFAVAGVPAALALLGL